MAQILSNTLLSADAGATTRIEVANKLIAMLKDKYGVAATQVTAPDELTLIRTAATLDFLANNLPRRER